VSDTGREVTGIFHLTAVTRDVEAATEVLGRLFGATVVHRADGETFGVAMRRAMVWLGDNLIEMIEPVGPSPFTAFMDRFGPGLNALGCHVGDAAAAEAHLAALGIEVAARYGPDMFATRTSATAGLALQWTSQWVADDPRRTGGRPAAEGVAPARRMAFVAAAVEDPATAASTLARALGTVATIGADGGQAGPGAVVGLGDCSLALYRRADGSAGWAPGPDRPRLVAIGLEVPDVEAAAAALDRAAVATVARHRSGLVLDPTALPVPVILCPGLLAGDPRSAVDQGSG
jgi:4-hydroxyphenylpyruvate dioxygenase-like putative hemolysin